ncbi:MAG: bifunctional nuclease family protein [Planctomycetes bacterium]|nr:bifunctional nuclease family protein [Planctomycetota bacterium]NUQ34080.1 bifunctional nuclease family protein [Planctomycetaceae bacterium]
MALVAAKLSKVMVLDNKTYHTIFIEEAGGAKRHFPIEIGLFEAVALIRKLDGEDTLRPMTHDLMQNVVSALGGSIKEVHITELKNATFFAEVVIETEDGEVTVDARPSDALVLAASAKVDLFVDDSVFQASMTV